MYICHIIFRRTVIDQGIVNHLIARVSADRARVGEPSISPPTCYALVIHGAEPFSRLLKILNPHQNAR